MSYRDRLHASLTRVEDRPVLSMPRSDWSRLRPEDDHLVALDLALTPLATVASRASILAATAQQSSAASSEIAVYRWDGNDQPTPVNVDRYAVWEDLSSHQSFPQKL